MRRPMTISGDVIDETENFKYLGSFVQNNGGFYMDVKHMIECDWMKWREALGILYNKRIPIRLKSKFYRSSLRPTMFYGSEY
jgi:hypothetical protein